MLQVKISQVVTSLGRTTGTSSRGSKNVVNTSSVYNFHLCSYNVSASKVSPCSDSLVETHTFNLSRNICPVIPPLLCASQFSSQFSSLSESRRFQLPGFFCLSGLETPPTFHSVETNLISCSKYVNINSKP